MLSALQRYRAEFTATAFWLLFAAATFVLLHPNAASAYRQFRAAATPSFHDTSGYAAHVVCYSTLAIAATVCLPSMRFSRLLILLVAHGVVTESLQAAVPGRTFDFADMACNAAAATITLVIARTAIRSAHCPDSKRGFNAKPVSDLQH